MLSAAARADGSLTGVAGKYDVCCWAVVQLASIVVTFPGKECMGPIPYILTCSAPLQEVGGGLSTWPWCA